MTTKFGSNSNIGSLFGCHC